MLARSSLFLLLLLLFPFPARLTPFCSFYLPYGYGVSVLSFVDDTRIDPQMTLSYARELDDLMNNVWLALWRLNMSKV